MDLFELGYKEDELRTENQEAKLDVVLKETIRLWRKHHLTYNQTAYITKKARQELEIRYSRPKQTIVQRLSKEESETLINYCYTKKSYYGLLIKTLFFTGCRVNEFVNIKIEHVNFQENEIYIEKGKGGKQRYVPIFNFLSQELRTHISNRMTGYLFETRQSKKYSTRRIQQIVKQFSKESGINRRVYPHLLRKSIATFLLNKGMPIDQVQKFLGHSRLETTQIYAATSIKALKDNYLRLIQEGKDG